MFGMESFFISGLFTPGLLRKIIGVEIPAVGVTARPFGIHRLEDHDVLIDA
jgi:hypothetical protein